MSEFMMLLGPIIAGLTLLSVGAIMKLQAESAHHRSEAQRLIIENLRLKFEIADLRKNPKDGVFR